MLFPNGGFNYFSLVTDLKGIEIIKATAMEEELVELIGTVSNRVRKITVQRSKITRKLQAIY